MCELQSRQRVLARDGSYARWIPLGNDRARGTIYRKYCRDCDVSFSLIPDFIVRHQRYNRPTVVGWLWTRLGGARCRSRSFLVEHGVDHPAPEGLISWTDLLDAERTRPGYQLLSRWERVFTLRAKRSVARLVYVCIALGCDFKREVANSLSSLASVPRSARALAVALGLWRSIVQATSTCGSEVELRAAFVSLVTHLTFRPLPPSHRLRRAFSEAVIYDALAWSGRPPPRATRQEAS